MKCTFLRKTVILRFGPLWGLRGNVRCSFETHRTFSLVLRLRRYTREYRLKMGVFSPTRPVWPKISRTGGCLNNHSFYQKTRMNDLLCGMRVWAQVSYVLSQSTRLTDGRTDGQTDGHFADGYTVRCITCSRTVKSNVGHFRCRNVLLKLSWRCRPIISTILQYVFFLIFSYRPKSWSNPTWYILI